MTRLVAVYRSPAYSPNQHRSNDTAILDAVVERLGAAGWSVTKTTEHDVEHGHLPAGQFYLNMCQGSLASEQLMPLEADGATVLNRPSSVLNCHRHRLVRFMAGSTLSFPRTLVLPSAGPIPANGALTAVARGGATVWVKRGDVHAERQEDVVRAPVEDLPGVIQAFVDRGIPWVALQEHVTGPVVKFYGIADGRFFRWYGSENGAKGARPEVDEDRLKALAFDAAALLHLEVFGGDVAFPEPDRPVLIDINDWPSFAPFRDEAAQAIANYVNDRARRGK